jgi:hypothetical protein
MPVRTAANRVVSSLATAVRVVAAVIGGIILLHAVFVLFDANPANPLVELTTSVRDTFGWFTENMFRMDDENIAEAINDAIAALIYVVVGNLLSTLILRLAPSAKARA